jgi:hypothetical protein
VADGGERFPQGFLRGAAAALHSARNAMKSTPSKAFGTFIWDIRFKDFQAEYDFARITWDEARHT